MDGKIFLIDEIIMGPDLSTASFKVIGGCERVLCNPGTYWILRTVIHHKKAGAIYS